MKETFETLNLDYIVKRIRNIFKKTIDIFNKLFIIFMIFTNILIMFVLAYFGNLLCFFFLFNIYYVLRYYLKVRSEKREAIMSGES